jgi:hypothetical protein
MDGQTDGWPLLLYPSPLSRGDNKKETSLELTLLNILLELSMILQSRGAKSEGNSGKIPKILMFLSPLPHVPLPFTKTNNDLKRMQLTSLE